MGFQIFTSDTVGNGVQADLLGTDDMYVEEGVTVGREDAAAAGDYTVSGIGSNHIVEIDGRVLGGGTAISLGNDGADRFSSVMISETGYVRSLHESAAAILMTGSSHTIKNAGKVVGATIGIEFTGGQLVPGSYSVIENTGTIDAAFAIMHTNSTELLKVFNHGTINAGTNAIFQSTGTAIDEFYNTGNMKGYIRLGGGDDLYDGRGGTFSGQIHGEDGNDRLLGGNGNEVFIGGFGNDYQQGGRGNDEYWLDAGDMIVELSGQGIDTVSSSSSYTLGANIENLGLGPNAVAGTGNALANVITANGTIANVLTGLAGNDTLSGGDGNDKLIGGAGKDTLTGGNHADRFIFNSVTESRAAGGIDRIVDFSRAQGDKIEFKAIDANTAKAGNQAFSFVGTKAFSGVAGELRYQKIGSDSIVSADVNGDGKADFTVISDVVVNFAKGDFIL
ncbi:MAG TPA: hypothetical protein VMF90_06440 [Rhizobiaceae bacterium]|nr:hypothetical protein [Rhizobiaceae bacterium]